jgi:hypothetical protein
MVILLVQIIVEIVFKKEGVRIFVYNKLKYNTINLEKSLIGKDIEACAIYLSISSLYEKKTPYIYRSKLYHENNNIIKCGDMLIT